MKQLSCMLLILCAMAATLRADAGTEQVQRTLKDQGFYYGEITGQMDADTTAAIRRYQIRNGLKVTGEVNAETQKSLGVSKQTQAAIPRPTPNEQEPAQTPTESVRATPPPPRPADQPSPGYVPGPHGLQPEMSGAFDGTPYEVAPPDVQRRVIVGAQTLLMRRGYYRSGIDGVYGPGMQSAVRAFQAEAGLALTARLDMQTLSALGLLPGEQLPAGRPGRGRFYRRPPREYTPNGEPIYEPR